MFSEHDLIIEKLVVAGALEWQNGPEGVGFFFPRKGGGVYSDGFATHSFSAGDLVVFNLGVPGSIRRLGRQKLTAAFFRAFLEHLVGIFTIWDFCILEKWLRNTRSPWVFPATGDLALKCHELVDSAPATQDLEHRCHLLRIVAQVFAEHFKSIKAVCPGYEGDRGSNGRMLNSLSIKQINTLSSEELARKHGYSQRHLNRLFHASFGRSFAALKMEMRLLKAAALLHDRGTKIVSIAADCGFNHVNLFSSRFKKRFGATPTQWRERVLSSAPKDGLGEDGGVCPLRAKGLCPLPGSYPQAASGNAGREKSPEPTAQENEFF